MDADEDDSLPDWSRTYAGYRERFVMPFVMELAPKVQLSLHQAPCVSAEHAKEAKASSDGSTTASTVWDAGVVLAAHVFNAYGKNAGQRPRLRCLDLGAGTGIVGLACAVSGVFERVVLTDMPTVVPLLERNANSHATLTSTRGGGTVKVLPMSWEDDAMLRSAMAHGPFDLLVGGDVLYRPQVVPPLLYALRHLAGPQTTVLLAASLQHSPDTITLFASAAQGAGFCVERLSRQDIHCGEWSSPEVRVLRVTRLPASDGASSMPEAASSMEDEPEPTEEGEGAAEGEGEADEVEEAAAHAISPSRRLDASKAKSRKRRRRGEEPPSASYFY